MITLSILNKRNSGPSAARNTGMLRATGDLIAFLDADDLWTQDKLMKQVIQFHLNNKVGIVYGQFINRVFRDKEQHVEYPVIKRFYKGQIKKELLQCNFIGTSTVMIKREVVTQIGLFNPDLRLAEDYDYWLENSKPIRGILLRYARAHQTLLRRAKHKRWTKP